MQHFFSQKSLYKRAHSFVFSLIILSCVAPSGALLGHLLDDMNVFCWDILFNVPRTERRKTRISENSQNLFEENDPSVEYLDLDGNQQDHPQPQTERTIPIERIKKKKGVTFDDVAGHDQLINRLRSLVHQFGNPERLRRFGGNAKKGILLAGPSGTGKTMIAEAIANELGYSFHKHSASEAVEIFVGSGAKKVRQLFEKAHKTAPSVIFFDEIDSIAAANRKESDSGGSMEYRQTLNEFLCQMNKLENNSAHKKILVVTATNMIEALDPAFKSPHRFEVVDVPLPDRQGRYDILALYLDRLSHVDITIDPEKHKEVDGDDLIDYLAANTRGLSGAQLESIVNNAVHIAVSDADAQEITADHILAAYHQAREALKTSIFGGGFLSKDNVKFSDIAGLGDVIGEFKDLLYGLQNPDKMRSYGVTQPKGILLEGKPGCGKTMMVQALANESNCTFYYASGSSFDGKYVGDGAKKMRELFQKANTVSPAIIFIDEIDAIGGAKGTQTLNEMLTQMDGFNKDSQITVIGATNILKHVDYRLRRPGRFDKIIKVDLPNQESRREILELYINKLPKVDHANVPYEALVLDTQNFSGAALKALVNDAAALACKEQADEVKAEHFEVALKRALKSKRSRQ